ncbi:MAG: TRAP transporter substrate-binding protein DctP [Treponema sp.]|nr:TRAP transporter substrate-binding protein DctP [Treponema sp.]MCL2252048.1 TRAP transporter substrate-binding protein DctP [Treponema sp.]
MKFFRTMNQKRYFKILFFCLLLFFILNPLFAQRALNVKLASLVPENTVWGQVINRLAAEWQQITGGQVNVTVFHGGTAGDESQVMTLLRSNQMQAAIFTSMGLSVIAPELMALSYPFLVRNDDEMNEVLRRLKPYIDDRLQRSGFVTLAWAHAGWVKLFSRAAFTTPDELRRMKLATGGEDQQTLQAFRIMGYQMVPIHLNEVVLSLQSGRIDATYISPIFAAASQLFGVASNMSNVNVAPFMGAVLMNDVTWRRIPDRFKPALMEANRRAEREIVSSLAALEADAIRTMSRHGLKIQEMTPVQMQVWYDDIQSYENRLVGNVNPIFNRDFYLRIKDILTEYRRGR